MLRGIRKSDRLPLWGPDCAAWSDDPGWFGKVNEAVKRYAGVKRYQEKVVD